MAIYTISNDETRFCSQAMIQCGGYWNSERKVWMFRQLADAADAAIEMYLDQERRYNEFRVRALQARAKRIGRGYLAGRPEYKRDEFRCFECREVRDVTTLRNSVCGECRSPQARRA